MRLNNNHKHHLTAVFRHLDQMFAEAIDNLEPLDQRRLFPPCFPDASNTQLQDINESISQLRDEIRRLMIEVGSPPPQPEVSGLHAFFVTLCFAKIDLFDLEPKQLSAFGEIDDETSSKMECHLEKLRNILDQLSQRLTRPTPPTTA
ncbi:hypothetical protein GALL_275130 [mine drainage metagenome]|uniref:Uncharacterized protein n=1 Tax=mine drainage metagenome TaxID=410659 RepID=A0A1J5R3P1_9ZZZZ